MVLIRLRHLRVIAFTPEIALERADVDHAGHDQQVRQVDADKRGARVGQGLRGVDIQGLHANGAREHHGVALIGSGILTSVDYAFVDRATPLFASIGRAANILFIYASLLSLEENIRIYNQAKNLEDKTAAHQLRCSAVLGIINTLGYIASGVLLVLGLSTTLALVIGIIAAFTGGLKVLYDLYRWSKEHSIHIDGLPN